MLDFTLDKASLRKQALSARKGLDPALRQALDTRIAAHVLASTAFEQAALVFAYASFGEEVDTFGVMRACWTQGKTVLLPRCVVGTRTLAWYVVQGEDDLEPGAYGILEPNADRCQLWRGSAAPSDLALVPGLVFDPQGFRIGYGGGYYDCFLPGFSGVAVGLCRVAFLSPQGIDHDPFDIPVKEVCTEEGFVRQMC